MKYKAIYVHAGYTQRAVLNHQSDEVIHCDTVAEAKKKARYLLTDQYQRLVEANRPLNYAMVVNEDEVLYDYFRRGYNEDAS